MADDFDLEFLGLVALVEEHGMAQKEDLEKQSGKTPKKGFWHVAPVAAKDRSPGATFWFYTDDGNSFRQLFPRNGCSARTIRMLTSAFERYGFDVATARKEAALRARKRAEAEQKAADEREKELHKQQAASRPQVVQQVKKKKKVYPTARLGEGDIGPSYAQDLLDEEGDGAIIARPLSPTNLTRFCNIIDNGLWVPDYFYFDPWGFCTNGRHRLTAIVRTGKTVFCRMIWGAPQELFAVCDSAKMRTGGETLFIKGLTPEGSQAHERMAAALKMLHSYKTGAPWGSWGKTRIENDYFIALAELYPQITDAMERAKLLHPGRATGRASYAPSAGAVFCYLAEERFPSCGSLLDEFMLAVTLGNNLDGKDPRKALYNLMANRQQPGSKRGPDANLNRIRQLALLLKMWNFWLSGKEAEVATWREGEQMPLAITEAEVVLLG